MTTPLFRVLPARGVYTLVILMKSSDYVEVSRLGNFVFQKGYYAYTGSAMSNLRKRVERHLARHKSKHWHIDFLLNSGEAKAMSVIASTAKQNIECRVNEAIMAIAGSSTPIRGFGASDCKQGCKSHLAYFGDSNPEKDILNAYRTLLKSDVVMSTAQAFRN